jgi:NAD(P)H dehydrogenase (quinone)
MMLASVAAMQGRIAMWHALGAAVQPIRLGHVAATIFTEPEIATVGVSQQAVASGAVDAAVVKLFARRSSGTVLGGARRAYQLAGRGSVSAAMGVVVYLLSLFEQQVPSHAIGRLGRAPGT